MSNLEIYFRLMEQIDRESKLGITTTAHEVTRVLNRAFPPVDGHAQKLVDLISTMKLNCERGSK